MLDGVVGSLPRGARTKEFPLRDSYARGKRVDGGRKEKKERGRGRRRRRRNRGVVVPADDEVALLLSLNTTRGS